jgi:AbrB family looped-hinge helix DNA binding protein
MYRQELRSTVTRKGQVTIPLQVRRLLGLRPNSRVVFSVEGDKVYLAAEAETLESIYGAVKPISQPEDFQRLRDQAIEDQVTQVLKEMTDDDLS